MFRASRMTISYCFAVLLDLAEDPWVAGGHAANHDRVAVRLGDHRAGVFGGTDVAVADDRDPDGVFDGGDPFPAGLAAVAHFTGAGMEGDCGQPAIFRHAG